MDHIAVLTLAVLLVFGRGIQYGQALFLGLIDLEAVCSIGTADIHAGDGTNTVALGGGSGGRSLQ